MTETFRYCAPCLFGVEGILGDELRRLGAQDVRPENGRVLFSGGLDIMARANISSRYAERIQIVMGTFVAKSFNDLFEGTRALPWERFVGKLNAFPVKGWSLDSQLHSVPDCQAIIKKAIVERLRDAHGTRFLNETGSRCQVQFTLHKDEATLLLDTSGAGLHMRGYRAKSGGAPIKETLAAAIVDVTRARRASLVCDPCCGSGTLLIEAALAARGIAPGIRRAFSAMHWDSIAADVWTQERERARSFERDVPFAARGGDIDREVLSLVGENADKAGVADCVSASYADIRDFTPSGESGTVLCNPPYGERMLNVKEAQELYRVMGRVFTPKEGWSYAIISPDEQFETYFGRPADKRRKLYNGMLKCQLYMYYK